MVPSWALACPACCSRAVAFRWWRRRRKRVKIAAINLKIRLDAGDATVRDFLFIFSGLSP